MPICSYVVVPRDGAKEALRQTLSAMAGCEVVPADNADLLLLVTTTEDLEADADLRCRVEALAGVEALLLTFGEVDADAPVADPLADLRAEGSQVPGRTASGAVMGASGMNQTGRPQ